MSVIASEDSMKKSVTAHCRIWKDVYDMLGEEARTHKVSMNTLMNQVLSSHVRDDLLWQEVGSVRMTNDAVRAMLTMLPDAKLSEWGKAVIKCGPDSMMLALDGGITPNSVLDVLRVFSRAGWFTIHESKGTVTFMHEFGPRYSTALAASVRGLFELVGSHPRITTTESSIMVEH